MTRNPRMMERHEFRALLRAARERHSHQAARDYFLFLFLGRTGLRISEALSLTPKDLFLLHVPPFCAVRSLKRRSDDDERDEVLLDEPAARAVRRYIRRVLPEVLGRTLYDADALFPARAAGRGHLSAPARPMTRRNALSLFRYYAKRAGLPEGKTLHSLRHYRGTYLYEKTRDVRFTQEQLRHGSLSSTQVYVHRSPAVIRRHLDRLSGRKGER